MRRLTYILLAALALTMAASAVGFVLPAHIKNGQQASPVYV
jgi:hypothetical protein